MSKTVWIMLAIVVGLLLVALPLRYPYVRLIPLGLAVVTVVYGLTALLHEPYPVAAKWLGIGFTAVLAIFGLVVGITGILIFQAGRVTPADCEYIVVLGAQVNPDGPSVSLQERIDRAYQYLQEHPDTVAVVSGGKGDNEHMAEGLCMYQELTAMGIAPHRIWVEDQAASTWGNLNYSLELIEEKTGTRPTKVGVVSHEFHLFRTAMQARDMGVTVEGIPAKTGDFQRWLHYFIREIAGVWHYILIGGTFQ